MGAFRAAEKLEEDAAALHAGSQSGIMVAAGWQDRGRKRLPEFRRLHGGATVHPLRFPVFLDRRGCPRPIRGEPSSPWGGAPRLQNANCRSVFSPMRRL